MSGSDPNLEHFDRALDPGGAADDSGGGDSGNHVRYDNAVAASENCPPAGHMVATRPLSSGEFKSRNAGSGKLGMFEGVFIPTTLNVLSILMFLRFGFIIGQAGLLGSLLLLFSSYTINLLTILSVSAIATNGVVRGGGAYYMISRSLGPEFGGSIGVVFYVGQVLNAGLNVVGFAAPLLSNFGEKSGAIAKVLPESPVWQFVYETGLLWVCTIICLIGPSMFAKSSKLLFVILVCATISIPVSAVFVKPYFSDAFDAWYTGPSWTTLKENLLPHFTKGAIGSDIPGKETFRDLFGIFFPATAGIFAGASMSGDLRNPSKSIPKGTLSGTLLTFVLYASVIVSIPATVSRTLLHRDIEVMRNSNLSPLLVVMGEFATSLFSALMGIIGAAKLLQAISRDGILPFIGAFGRGWGKDDNPLLAIFFTYILAQLTILLDINKIAVIITMAFLVTFVVTNLACFLLDVSSAPNFRPSFRWFDSSTALVGTLLSAAAMFATDPFAAAQSVILSIALFVLIHFYSPPKPWGDVSQALIYHQVRKYLLRLRQDHVKYWRPQILLLVDDPRSSWSLIKFCSHLKKGGLFILGHVIVAKDFNEEFPEIEKQRTAWTSLRDACGIKAFIQVSASVDLVWGVRNVLLGSGLGGMKPNITVLGFYDDSEPLATISDFQGITMERLPTDNCRKEEHSSLTQWVNIIEDLLTMKTNLAVAKGFLDLELPMTSGFHESDLSNSKGYIDLYPIQMSAKLVSREGGASGLSINFDTYTLILQLGAILHTVPAWNKAHNLRVIAFVEYASEVDRETVEVRELLDKLRIPAEVLVVPLEGTNKVYDVIANGAPDDGDYVHGKLKNSKWWQELVDGRASTQHSSSVKITRSNSGGYVVPEGFSFKRRQRSSFMQQLGVAHSMQSTHILDQHLSTYYGDESESESELDMNSSITQGGGQEDKTTTSLLAQGSNASRDRTRGSAETGSSDEDEDADPERIPRAVCLRRDVSLNPSETFIFDGRERDQAQARVRSSAAAPASSAPTDRYKDEPQSRITFNDMPARPQHLILNSLMKDISKDSVVLFTTLPAPARGTHLSVQASQKYHDLLELFCEGLPPMVLIHAQSLTVTTSL